MQFKQAVALLAAIGTSLAVHADEILHPQSSAPMTMFYVSIPLGAATAKERAPSYGFALQGKRQYEAVRVDSRMLNAFESLLGGIEAKWLIAGGVVVAAGVYAASKDDRRSETYSGSQNQQQNASPPPANCQPDPCNK
jgi:hypothetical protein